MIGESTTKAIKGAGALSELLDCIGGGVDDHAAAKVLVDSERELRCLLRWALEHFASTST